MNIPHCMSILPIGYTIISDGFTYVLVNPDAPQLTASWQAIPKVYIANLTQIGESAPIATVFENGLGDVPESAYADVGIFTLSGTGLFPEGRTTVQIGNLESTDLVFSWDTNVRWTDEDTVSIYTSQNYVNEEGYRHVPNNGGLTNTMVEIRVYPA